MAPHHFRPPGYIELVQGQSDIGSFENDVKQGRLGTARRDSPLSNEQRLWLAVMERAAADAAGMEMGDLAFDDEFREITAAGVVEELRERVVREARAWLRGEPDFWTVMEWLGLGEKAAGALINTKPEMLWKNLREARGEK